MITRDFLLHNGFEFRNWEDSFQNEEHWTPEGEYTKRIDGNKFITIGYSKLYKWNYEIRNCKSHILISADCQDVIYIDRLQTLIDSAEIELTLKRPDSIPLSDFRRNVDFAVLFDFGDNDFCIPMATAAEFYCDEFNRLLEKIDLNEHSNDSNFNKVVDDFNKLCELENVKEVMKCGFMSERLNGLAKSNWKNTRNDPNESSFNKMRSDLDYIFGNDKKQRWGKVDGKYIVVAEMDRLITGTNEEISTAIEKYGDKDRHKKLAATEDKFPVWCNDEVLVLYMKDGFLTYMFR